jgi:hypothetical protein
LRVAAKTAAGQDDAESGPPSGLRSGRMYAGRGLN